MNAFRIALAALSCALGAFAAPRARVEPESLNFGTVKAGAAVDQTITIHNDGDAPLRVLRTKATCGCTTVTAPDSANAGIAPGGSEVVTVRFDAAGRAGEQSTAIAITTNDPARPAVMVPVSAFVETLTVLRPPKGLSWQQAARGGEIRRTVVIVPGDAAKPIELVGIASKSPALIVTAAQVTRSGQQMIDVKFALAKDAPLGALDTAVEARVRVGGEETVVTIPARGTVVGGVTVTPPSIVETGHAVARGAPIGEVLVRASGGGPAPEIAGIETIGPVRAELVPAPGEDVRKIVVRAADDAPAGTCSGVVIAMASVGDQPIVRVPVFFATEGIVAIEPREVVLGPAQPVQRIELRHGAGGAVQITGLTFDKAIVHATAVVEKQEDADTPAVVEVSIADPTAAALRGTLLRIETDVPGEETIAVPVLVRP